MRVGHIIDDRCRPCGMVRQHTVVALGPDGGVLRVHCDTCGSLHNYRGGATPPPVARPTRAAGDAIGLEPRTTAARQWHNAEVDVDLENLERMLRQVIREEAGFTPVTLGDRWRGGQLVLRPGREGVQEKAWPIETFFHKVVMLRNRLRVLEQQINGADDISEEQKLKLQAYITGCYGTLTSFNVLFAEEGDRFRGASG